MTTKEQIEWLESIKKSIHGGDDEYDRKRHEALDGAIKELKAKLSTERLICNSCRKKYGCRHYGFAKEFIKENPNNDMKCEIYEKE